MTKDKQIIIDVCPYQGECSVSGCKRNDNGCFVRQLFEERYRAENQIVELNKTIQAKEQECERLNKELHKNFEEKDTLHLIIDRLLEASGYDTNTASAEDFEDVYEHMRYEQEQLDQLKQTLADIKPIVEFYSNSKLGVEQPNGTYSMEIKDDKVIGGTYTITYNPNPAKTALDKINEVI